MRILGIDYGTKRIGVALSDPEAKFGQPYSVIKNSKKGEMKVLAEILEIIKKERVSEIVLGESKDFKGEDNPVMVEIQEFKKKLDELMLSEKPALSIPIVFEPEFLTSHQAEFFQGKTELLDASAAAIILQSYLDKNRDNFGKKETDERVKIEEKKAETTAKTFISIDDFAKVEIRAGKILNAETITGSNKLLRLETDFGEEKPRQVVSGIAKHFPDPSALIGRQVGFVTNLQPRAIMGLESQAMILAVSTDTSFSLLSIDSSVPPGTKIK